MSRVRFATALALYEAFPEVSPKIGTAPTDRSPIEFLKKLSSDGKLPDAVTFCAYLLPRREAVWWACGCARALLGDIARDRAAGLMAAEAWVYEPDDKHRQAALEIGTEGDRNDPLTWLALAAGWSGGFLTSPPNTQNPVPPTMSARAARLAALFGVATSTPNTQRPVPPTMTARAARLAVLFSAAKIGGAERQARLQSCIAEGIKLAETGL